MVKHNYRGTIEPWATMYKEMKKIQTENRVYCWSPKQTRNGDKFSDFADLLFFFGVKNVRVGGKILGSIENTHVFFLA